MRPPEVHPVRPHAGPSFYVMDRQTVRPTAVLLAVLAAAGALYLGALGLKHNKGRHFAESGGTAGSQAAGDADDKDDPSQVDVIVLGDPGDAPVPARKRTGHVSSVHPTILIRLPSTGPQVGMIPESAAGHLLYDWLAAFNHADATALGEALPSRALQASVAAQMELRRQTGGFNLLSAKEVEPGLLVFRLRDQTAAGGEVLGTLQVQPNRSPAAIGSFSLRAVVAEGLDAGGPAQPSK